MFKIRPDDIGEMANLLHEPEEIEKWLLAEIEKYAEDK
jgi:hypothetical protein